MRRSPAIPRRRVIGAVRPSPTWRWRACSPGAAAWTRPWRFARESVALSMAGTQEIPTRPWLLTREADVPSALGWSTRRPAAATTSLGAQGATAEVRLAQQRLAAVEAG